MISDELASDITQNGKADFIAATPGAVELAVSVPLPFLAFHNGNLDSWFEPGDNILLQTVDVNIPHGFAQGSGEHHIIAVWRNNAGLEQNISELQNNSVITIPDLCGSFKFPGNGLFVLAPTTLGRVQLVLKAIDLNVSQVNLPAILNGVRVHVQYLLQIGHTKPLGAVP